jgi:hypothetical protein
MLLALLRHILTQTLGFTAAFASWNLVQVEAFQESSQRKTELAM